MWIWAGEVMQEASLSKMTLARVQFRLPSLAFSFSRVLLCPLPGKVEEKKFGWRVDLSIPLPSLSHLPFLPHHHITPVCSARALLWLRFRIVSILCHTTPQHHLDNRKRHSDGRMAWGTEHKRMIIPRWADINTPVFVSLLSFSSGVQM